MTFSTRFLVVFLAYLGLCGCASVDFDYPRAESYVLPDTSDTHLANELRDTVAGKPEGHAGFYALVDGIDSLAIRLLMAERAEKSIDTQYYLIKSDVVGRAFTRALLRAADRGVRVRLLLDDIFTKGYDTGMMALDSHPNFEIRIFNPFNRGAAGRTLGAATNFGRINRRMHNKSFTVDNQVTLIGGRNIADEYFGARVDAKFGDLDVLGIGPVVQDVSDMFDSYWNHETALPVGAFLPELEDPAAELDRIRRGLEAAREEVIDSKYADAVKAKVLKFVETDSSAFEWAPYALVYDSPDKGVKSLSKQAAKITTSLVDALQKAEKEVIILSPYFVPRKSGVEGISALRKRGVEVTIITNSLAANNQFTVHGGYAPSRKPLLQNDIKIYEVRPDADVAGAEIVAASGAKATLHTKAFVVDRRYVFIGSFNFDPRSANINTELGVIIDDPELASRMVDSLVGVLPKETYEVFLDDRGRVRWRGFEDGKEVIFDKEPRTTWGQRFTAGFMRFVPIRSQL